MFYRFAIKLSALLRFAMLYTRMQPTKKVKNGLEILDRTTTQQK